MFARLLMLATLLAAAAVAAEPEPSEDLELSSSSVSQGGAILLTLDGGRTTATARFLNRTYTLYPVRDADTLQALIGVDLEDAPGNYPVTVEAREPTGAPFTARMTVRVTAGRFSVQRLKVPHRMVHPDEESNRRIAQEEALLEATFAGRTAKLFEGAFLRPVPGALTNSFGGRRIFNGVPKSPHSGADLRGAEGTPVKAPARGKVVLVRDLYFSGNTVILDHGLGLFTLYGHLSKTKVREGQIVSRRTVLGLVGMTGRATGPHLHWGAKACGARVNPIDLTRLKL